MVGCIILCYFTGVMVASILIRDIQTQFTKRSIFLSFLGISLAAQVGLIFWVESIYQIFLMMFIIGFSRPGKREGGLSYIFDFIQDSNKQMRIFTLSLLDYPSMMLLALSYQYLHRTWKLQ